MNRVKGPFTATVNGRETGLAGCLYPCERADECLRADPQLNLRAVMRKDDEPCRMFITNQAEDDTP